MTNMNPLRTYGAPVHWFLAAGGLTGIVALFLPFTWGVSPVDAALSRGFWKIATPFFLSILISGASIRWAVSRSLSRVERWVAYMLSCASAFATLFFVFLPSNPWPSNAQEWGAWGLPVPVLALGAFAVIRNARFGMLPDLSAVMAMQAAYLANSLFCLVAFWGDWGGGWQIGAYFVLVASVIYLVQIVLISMQPRPQHTA